jgi:hypothetical protein
MKLYHHCRPSDLESIAEKGLYPHASESPIMSVGCEVAWLKQTSSTSTVFVFPRNRLNRLLGTVGC